MADEKDQDDRKIPDYSIYEAKEAPEKDKLNIVKRGCAREYAYRAGVRIPVDPQIHRWRAFKENQQRVLRKVLEWHSWDVDRANLFMRTVHPDLGAAPKQFMNQRQIRGLWKWIQKGIKRAKAKND